MDRIIEYRIKFHSFWHCGSGLSSGPDADALVRKDRDGFPYVPGRTVKGLLREAAEEICSFNGDKDTDRISQLFGQFEDKDNHQQGKVYFSSAELPMTEKSAIDNQLRQHLYTNISSTAIDDDGIVIQGSLRSTEYTIPCALTGRISGDISTEDLVFISNCMGMIKRAGLGRSRGYGRCDFEIINEM